MPKMKVTGGTGFSGSHIIDMHIERGQADDVFVAGRMM